MLRLTKVPAVLIEGGFLTERGESKLISNKDWRAKVAGAIGVGIESYRALGVKKQPPMLVADYRKQTKSAPIEPGIATKKLTEATSASAEPATQEGRLKEADASLMNLVGKSKFVSPQQSSTPSKRSPLESAPIVP